MALTLSLNSSITVDESSLLQNETASLAAGDVNDNDISVGSINGTNDVGDLPDAFESRLFALLGVAAPLQVALSGYDGANSGADLLTISGGTYDDLAFTDATGAPLDGDWSGLYTLDGTQIFLYTDPTNNNIVLGRKGTAAGVPNAEDDTASSTGQIVFAAYLEQTATGAKVWMTLFQPVSHPDATNDHDFTVDMTNHLWVAATQELTFDFAGLPSGQNKFLMFKASGTSEIGLIVTGGDPDRVDSKGNDVGDTVNTSQGGGPTTIGTNNQAIDPPKGQTPGEAMIFTFVNRPNPAYTVPDLTHGEAVLEANIDYDYDPTNTIPAGNELFGASGATIQISQQTPPKASTAKISAYNTEFEEQNDYYEGLITDDVLAYIASVTVYNASGAVVAGFNGVTTNTTIGSLSVTFTVVGAGRTATIGGFESGYSLEYTTNGLHNRVMIENVGGSFGSSPFDIGGFTLPNTVVAPQEVGSALNFEDDGPNAGGTPQGGTVDEDGLTGASTGISGGANDVAGTAFSTTGSLAAIFNAGNDGLGGYSLSGSAAALAGIAAYDPISDPGLTTPLALTSKGQPVLYHVSGTTLTGYVEVTGAGYVAADDREVFTLVLSGTNNVDFTFTLLDQIDHPSLDGVLGQDDTENDLLLHLGSVLRVTDRDGDFVEADPNKLAILVDDDSPTATGTPVTATVDEDGLTGGIAGGPGDVAGEAFSATGSIAGIFQSGADEPATYGMGTDTGGLISTLKSKGGDVVYNVNGNTLTAYVEVSGTGYNADDDREVFTLALSGTGNTTYTYTLLDQLDHPTANTEDDIVLNLGSVLQATDFDGDKVTAAAEKLAITVDDDSPVVTAKSNLVYANQSNPTPGGTGIFRYSIGADERLGTTYSALNSDLSVSLTGVSVGSNAITLGSVTWFSESDTQAVFNVAFTYVSDPISETTTNASGTLTFNKAGGTYTLALSQPIASYSILSTANAQGFTGYVPGSSTIDNTQPAVTVAALASNFFVQFTGYSEPGGGTDTSNANNNLDAIGINVAVTQPAAGGDDAFVNGEVFKQAASWASVSGEAAGVAGDTMQQGEVLDLDFFSTNPTGFTALAPTTTSSAIFLEFDALDNNEDLVIILKLVDASNPANRTTKAVIADYGDIFHKADAGDIPVSFGFTGDLDNNDGLVVIERADYNFAGENWVIEGAQVLASTEGVSGTGIDLQGDIGVGSSGLTQTFADATDTQNTLPNGNEAGTWDGDVFKIVNIGFVTEASQNGLLTFDVVVKDFDGDTSSTQTLAVSIVADGSLTPTSSADTFVFAGLDTDGLLAATMYNVTSGFASGTDKLDFATAGAVGNYAENLSAAATVSAFVTAADAALNATVLYYFGVVGADGYLAADFDNNGITTVVKLAGVTDLAFGDII